MESHACVPSSAVPIVELCYIALRSIYNSQEKSACYTKTYIIDLYIVWWCQILKSHMLKHTHTHSLFLSYSLNNTLLHFYIKYIVNAVIGYLDDDGGGSGGWWVLLFSLDRNEIETEQNRIAPNKIENRTDIIIYVYYSSECGHNPQLMKCHVCFNDVLLILSFVFVVCCP